VPSRAAARTAIEDGQVKVGDVPVPKPATLVDHATSVSVVGEVRRFVSRGGEKLAGALETFDIDVADVRCIDVGASTGGFTDCLLQRGAASVVAVDVGYGQLAWSVAQDERVTVVDRTNIRHADPVALGAPFDVVVADLSFISLRTVAPAIASLGTNGSVYVLLVKPQFEVGRSDIGKGGIVRDAAAVERAVSAVVAELDSVGLGARAAVPSSIKGAKGNQEFLLYTVYGAPSDHDAVMRGIR